MSNSELYTTWFWSLGIAAAVVLIAAGLLIAIILTARSILRHVQTALEAVEGIAGDTAVIWELDTTNRVAGEILDTATSIEERGARIVAALHHEPRPAETSEVER